MPFARTKTSCLTEFLFLCFVFNSKMRNSFISDLLRFANPTQNFPSRLSGIDYNSNELSSVPGFNLYGMTNNSSVDIPNFANLTPQTYLGALQATNGSDISFVGTEIDEYLTRASQMFFKDTPINVDGAAMFNDSDDELAILDNMEPVPGNYTTTFTNEEVCFDLCINFFLFIILLANF